MEDFRDREKRQLNLNDATVTAWW